VRRASDQKEREGKVDGFTTRSGEVALVEDSDLVVLWKRIVEEQKKSQLATRECTGERYKGDRRRDER